MKQIYIALAAAFMGLSVMPAANAQDFENRAEQVGALKSIKAPQRLMNLDNTELVTNYRGTFTNTVMSGYALYPDEMGMYLLGLQYDGKQSAMAVDEENNKLYIYNPFSRQATGSYIVGDITTDEDGKTIAEFSFPQLIYQGVPNDPSTYLYACIVAPAPDGLTYAPIGKQDMYFEKVGEKWVMQLPTSTAIIGIIDYTQTWQYVGERSVVYEPFTDQTVRTPADLQTEKWDMVYRGTTGHKVNVGFDGDDVYIQGVCPEFSYSWIKGKVNGNKIEFDKYQYLGVNGLGYYAWVVGGQPLEDDPEHFTFNETLVMDYNKDDRTFSYPDWLLVESSKTMSLTLHRYKQPSFTDPASMAMSYQPAQPVITYFYPKVGKWGWTWFEVDVPSVSVSNHLLNTNNLIYKVYIDGELYTFDPSNGFYVGLTQPMIEFPWGFDDGQWHFVTDLEHFKITLDIGGIDTIQVESVYRENGNEYSNKSEVWICRDGVSAIDAEEVESFYTNLCGCRVENPENGVYVKTTVYSNGQRRSEKVVLK